jgi:hypothetical protein
VVGLQPAIQWSDRSRELAQGAAKTDTASRSVACAFTL